MDSKEILENALYLKPQDKVGIIEGLLKSLDEPDKTIDEMWTTEAEKRLKAYREGKLKGIEVSEVFEFNWLPESNGQNVRLITISNMLLTRFYALNEGCTARKMR